MIAIFFWWIGLSIVVAVAANTRGRSPIAWFIYAIIFSPLLSGLLLLALPNLANSFAAGRMYLEGELRELEERRRRRAIVARQITEAFPWNEAPRYLIRDRDCVYGIAVTHRLRAMGIRDKPIAPGSPWQNGFAERLIGSIRRECVDHVVVLGEAHLRRILTKYAAYYNELRTHRSLNKDAPIYRAIQHVGCIVSAPVLGGLHHQYCRIRFSVHTRDGE
jgi:hypothetical protein